MVVVLCAFVQGQSSNAIVKEKGPHRAGLLSQKTRGPKSPRISYQPPSRCPLLPWDFGSR